jgi:Nucleotidyl transferase AbiEii toxin, Type IV TA system
MTPFSNLPPDERALVINEAASRLGLAPLIVEKDFWVSWTLGRIFEVEAVAPHVVFKGGTSLSKVFGAIRRFSEDIDLAVSPQALGFAAAELDEAPSASQRRKRVQALEAECERCVAERFRPALEAAIAARLGAPQHTSGWLRYEIDALAGTPNLLFTYPSALAQAGGYVAPGRLNCRSVTASPATTRTSRRCGATRAALRRWRGSICSKTWFDTRAASSPPAGPTTKPPGRGRSGSFRRLRAMLPWRGTMRRWPRCSSACRSSSMSCCSAFRLRSSSSMMGAYFVPSDPHIVGV